jgi:PKD repeat protein
MKLRFAVTVSNIDYAWQGQTNLNFVNALMVPDENGTTVSFAGGDVQTVTLNYSLDPTWPVEDIEFIAFVQNDQGKEILQGAKRAAIDLHVDFSASTNQVNKDQEVTFTNNTTGGFIHAPEIYHWEFPGATPDTSNLENPVVTYTECGLHPVTLIVNHGGQIDTVTKAAYIHVGPIVSVAALPNDTACRDVAITLDATTPNAASYFWQPGGATTPTMVVAYPEYSLGAHTFTVSVTGNDGCVTTESSTIFIDECTGFPQPESEPSVRIFPNPTRGKFTVEITSPGVMTADLTISSILGNVVYRETGLGIDGKLHKELNPGNLGPGIYFLTLTSGELKIVRKIFVN